jgi:erythromycin esterase
MRTRAAASLFLALVGCHHPATPAREAAAVAADLNGIVGTVRDAAGAPIVGALVAAVSVDAKDDDAPAIAHSDANGAFTLVDVPAGTYGVTATADGKEGVFQPHVQVAAGRSTRVALSLGTGGVTLAGMVSDVTGRPLPSTLVSFGRTSNESGDVWYATSDASGHFRVTVPTAAYSVSGKRARFLRSRTYVLAAQAAQPIHVELEPQDASSFAGPSVVEQLRKASVSLDTCDPNVALGEDLAGLERLVGDARFVGLGESAHGGHENFLLKHRLFRYLVEKLGFTVLAIEASWPDTVALNDYVAGGKGDPTLLVPRMRFWIWDTDEMVALVRWMRAYNADARHTKKLSFVGFDMQSAPTAVAAIESYVGAVDRALAAKLTHELADLGDEYEANHVERWPAPATQATRDAVAALLSSFDEHKAAWSRRTGEASWAAARHHAEILSQFLQLFADAPGYDQVRERSMADNLAWIADHQPPGTRIAVWAANLHVAKSSWWGGPTPSMGGFLRQKYGDRYVAFGLSFVAGAIRAVGISPPRPVMEFNAAAAPPGSVEGTIGQIGSEVVAVDIAHQPAESEVARWARYRLRMRMIGAAYTESWKGSFVSLHPAALYDALFIVRQMTASHYAGPINVGSKPLSAPTNLGLDEASSAAPAAWRVGGLGVNSGYHASVEHSGCVQGSGCARVSRSAPVRMGGFGTLEQAVDATALRGHRVRLRASIRLDAVVSSGGAQLFLQAENERGDLLAAANMFDRAARSTSWGVYEVLLDLPASTGVLRYGMALSGDTAARLDAVTIEIADPPAGTSAR